MRVYSELTNNEIDEVLKSCQKLGVKESLRALWGIFKDLDGDKELLELKGTIKFKGKIISFDIRNVIYGEVEEYYDSNNVKIKGCYKIDIHAYWDELEFREGEMKKIIREQYEEGMQKLGEVEGHD